MAERLILDTSVLFSAERGYLDLAAAAGDDADAAVPAIVLAEYLTGVHLAASDTQRAARKEFLKRVLQVLPIETSTQRVADRHAELLAYVYRCGTTRAAHHLIIAATAVATGRTVLTTDTRAGFDQLPGVSVRVLA